MESLRETLPNNKRKGILMIKFAFGILLLAYLAAANAQAAAPAPGTLVMTVAYCPTAFTGGGALIQVDPRTAKWSIMKKFTWPKQLQQQGCLALDDPALLFDSASGTIYFDFTELAGLLVALNVKTGVTTAIEPHEMFFTGFVNMAVEKSGQLLTGLTPTVTQDGFCNDGCIGYGQFAIGTSQSKYKRLSVLPFKAILDDSHFLDTSKQVYYFQASYDLREGAARCAPKPSDECLLAVDATSGKLLSSKFTNWTVYDYAPTSSSADGTVLGFLEGFDDFCNDRFNNYLFARVNLASATASPIACISNSTVIDEAPWVSSFSLDESLFATASGDAEAGSAQIVVFDAQSGATLVNNQLPGLGKALGAFKGLFWVWDVQFMSL